MFEKPPDEPVDGQRTVFGAATRRLDVAECHLVVRDPLDPVVAQCDTEDVAGQIFQCRLATPHWPTIDHPGLCPGLSTHRSIQLRLAQRRPHLGAKQLRKRFAMHQKRAPTDDPGLPIRRQRERRNQVVDMGMKAQIARPGLQHPEHANLPTEKAWIVRECWRATVRRPAGRVNVTRKYGTGSNSSCCWANQVWLASCWQVGQWRLRQEW